jgi:multidrug resistance efflux pump
MSETVRRPPDEHEVAWRRNFWIILTLFGISLVALLLLLATLGIWWSTLRTSREVARPAGKATPAAPPVPAPLPVAVILAREVRTTTTLALPAHLRAGVDWYVAAPASGRVARVLAAPGARVAAGEVVARIATSVRRGPSGRRGRSVFGRAAAGDEGSLLPPTKTGEPRLGRAAASGGGRSPGGSRGPGSPGRLARPSPPSRPRWVTRPPSAAAVAAREERVRMATGRLARAESAVRAAESDLAAAREARARDQSSREAARQDLGEAEALVAQARTDLASHDGAVRQVESLYQSGAASHSEVNDERSARATASDRLNRAQARAQTARTAAANANAAVLRAEAAIGAAQSRLTAARAEEAAARDTARAAESVRPTPLRRVPPPQPEVVPAPPAATSSPGWSVVSTFADARAPAGGVVTTLLAGSGTYVTRGHALMRVTRPGGYRYRAEGPADRLRGVRPGSPARLRVAGGAPVPARISAVFLLGPSSAVAPLPPGEGRWGGVGAGGKGPRRRIGVEVVSAGAAPGRSPGGSAVVELTVPGPATVAIVPARAVRHTPAGAVLWVAQRTRDKGSGTAWVARRRRVRVGAGQDGHVQIRAGLEPGSQVIVAGMEKLRDGQAVAAVPWSLP